MVELVFLIGFDTFHIESLVTNLDTIIDLDLTCNKIIGKVQHVCVDEHAAELRKRLERVVVAITVHVHVALRRSSVRVPILARRQRAVSTLPVCVACAHVVLAAHAMARALVRAEGRT